MKKLPILLLAAFLSVVYCYKTLNALVPPPALPPGDKRHVIVMKVTAYDRDRACTGKWSEFGKTTTGSDAKIPNGVAADFGMLPPGTVLYIPKVGIRVVDDGGGGMRQSAKHGVYHIDVRFKTHTEARNFGIKRLSVQVMD